jgi:hypothetical protein
MLPDLSTSYHPTAQYHPAAYQDPSMGLGPFVDMDGYGPPRRQRIAPDLDALFDELASLDGAEKYVSPSLKLTTMMTDLATSQSR